MLQLVQITDFNLVRLRGCALECAGVLALSLSENGKQAFAPFLETFMGAAVAVCLQCEKEKLFSCFMFHVFFFFVFTL
jgi:hypothetical protein